MSTGFFSWLIWVGYLSKMTWMLPKCCKKLGGVCCIILRYVVSWKFQDLTSSSMSIFCWRCFCFQLPMDWLIWFLMGWNGSSLTVVGPRRMEHHGVMGFSSLLPLVGGGWTMRKCSSSCVERRYYLLSVFQKPLYMVDATLCSRFSIHIHCQCCLSCGSELAYMLTLSYMLDTCLTLLGWEWQHLVFWIVIFLRFFNHPLKPRHHLQCCLSNRCFEKGQQTRLWHLCDKRMAR